MKKCRYCNEDIQDDAVKCRFCGEWLNKESKTNIAPVNVKFPKIWPGYIIGLLALALQVFQLSIGPLPPSEFGSKMIMIIILSAALGLGGFIYWSICLYKIHESILRMADGQYPILPARAVVFGLVPFYNLYWMFKWPSEAINFINTREKGKRLSSWFLGVVLLVSSLFSFFIGFIWFLGSFGALSYLTNALKKSLAIEPLPTPYKSRPAPLSTGIIIALVCIPLLFILLLAAIAIPNFVRAKGMAQTAACRANLAMIDTAKKVWAMDTGAESGKTPTWSDLADYMKEKPVCLKGGTYEIDSVDSSATCSIGNNGTETPADDHVLVR